MFPASGVTADFIPSEHKSTTLRTAIRLSIENKYERISIHMKVVNLNVTTTNIPSLKFTVIWNGDLYKLFTLNLSCRHHAELTESADHINQRQEG